jgi:hypothetical protein
MNWSESQLENEGEQEAFRKILEVLDPYDVAARKRILFWSTRLAEYLPKKSAPICERKLRG